MNAVPWLDRRFDFDADDADRRVAECIYLERLAAQERGEIDSHSELEPTTEEINVMR